MSKKYETTGVIVGGVLKMRNRAALEREFKGWKDGDVAITIEKLHATRSLDQNALYFAGYVAPLAEYTGYSARQIHRYLKKKFLKPEQLLIQDRDGVVLDESDLEPTTTTLNKIEFGEYLDQIREWVLDTFHDAVTVGTNREAA